MKTQSDLSSEDINPRLLEALASLNQISSAINNLGAEETNSRTASLQLIAESAIRVIGGSSAEIYAYDHAAAAFDSNSHVYAYPEDHARSTARADLVDSPRENGYGARTISRKHRTLSYEETDLEIHPYHADLGVKVAACFPLIVANQVRGVLYIYLYEDRSLSQLEELMLDNFVNQAAMAIYHTHHLAGIQRDLAHKEDELNRLRRAGLLISSRLRLEETLESILELALEISNAQYGIFRLLDKSGEYLVTRAVSSVHLEKPLVEKLPLHGRSIMAHVARTREPVLIHDLRKPPWSELYYPLDSELEMRSELTVPLINASGRLEGVLNLESPKLHGFSEEDSHLLQSLATYAITAIQEVRLLDALQEAAQLLISQPSQKVLDQLCAMANDLLNTTSSAIWLKSDNGKMQASAHDGLINTASYPASATDALAIPLLAGDNREALGSFEAYHAENAEARGDKSEWDKKVLTCLANFAVLAIQNESHQTALRASREQHLIAETFAAVGDISANLLHNMNNKLGSIPVRVQGIQDKYGQMLKTDAYLSGSLNEIERSAMAAMQIVQDNLSHLRPIGIEKVRIAPRISDALQSIQIPVEIQVEKQDLENLPAVAANGQNLTFVFKNLLENAMDAMKGKGSITIRGTSNQSWVEVALTDTGPGISTEAQAQIFELEFSSQVNPGKLGFGLWWVKTWMTRVGGTVSVESDGLHGSTFHLRLPLADQ